MNELEQICGRMLGILQQLELTLVEEQRLLSAGQVNPALLHRVTENKNEQLTTLQYVDQQRQRLAATLYAGIPPYGAFPGLHQIWLAITQLTENLSRNNYRNGLLLSQHFTHNQQVLTVLEEYQTQRRMYGPDGQSLGGGALGRRFSV
ncbi:flagella synthesis protein FlgN [Acerihabitans arboris]|uniref:Flagellar biosynthesis protein FlgN n=1 Tax=Acerihabitans arboris TaxID=2691583 RepID=A0A845SHV6_9GAMM|nr:flagellar export chaperone FlgN [Acerihabitans arboris]NDL62626.1 flagellar biosynthesis protein FlgN [Acerihabitans arboris]